jgi:hypothetical protein
MVRSAAHAAALIAVLSAPAMAAELTPQVLESNFRGAHISVTADRSVTAIVDPVQVSIAVETDVGLAIALPSGESVMGPFHLISERDEGPFWAGQGRQRWERHYTLRARAAGEQRLPSLPVLVEDENTVNHFACVRMDRCGGELMDGGSAMRRLRTRPLTVRVTSVLPDDAVPTRPKGAAPPLDLERPATLPPLGQMLAVAGALALAALALTFMLGRKRAERRRALAQRKAHDLALAALERLAGLEQAGGARIHEFHARLSAILRTYLVGRFGLPATKRTTEEILHAALTAQHDGLGPTLGQCDHVKFGRGQPPETDMRERLRATVTFVEETADILPKKKAQA